MFKDLSEMLSKIDSFIETSDDDEAVQIVSSLYLMVLSLAGELNKVNLEIKLLERDLKILSDDDDDNDPIAAFLDRQENLVS